jgi:hypothetical protein
MATKPRTKELCWKVIERLEYENEAMSSALHKMSNEAAVALAEKDKELLEKCRTCKRGIR